MVRRPDTALTADQEDYLSARISEAVRSYARRATVGFAILAAGIITVFTIGTDHNNEARQAVVDSGHAVAVVGCNRDFKTMTELRAIIKDGRENVRALVEEGALTPSQGARSRLNYNEALERLRLPDCRDAADALTADPDEDIRIPEPLYPGGG